VTNRATAQPCHSDRIGVRRRPGTVWRRGGDGESNLRMTLPPDLPSLDSPGNGALIVAAKALIDAPVVDNAALRARAGDASRARRCCRGRQWHIGFDAAAIAVIGHWRFRLSLLPGSVANAEPGGHGAHRPRQGVPSEGRVVIASDGLARCGFDAGEDGQHDRDGLCGGRSDEPRGESHAGLELIQNAPGRVRLAMTEAPSQ
jgi:hypothetical protein